MGWLGRLLDLLGFERFDIGRGGDTYLTRWVLWGSRYGEGGKVFVHRFARGDHDEALHDHPWHFWSLILCGGYWEHRPGPGGAGTERVWCGPLSLLRRPAEWRHRVELPAGRTCWSLVWTSAKKRSWFFHCPQGAVPWRDFIARAEAGASGCGEG